MMNTRNSLKFVGSLDELSVSCSFESNRKISILQIDSFNFCLFIYTAQSCRISCLKLNVNEKTFDYEDFSTNDGNLTADTKPIEIYLLNVFCMPFALLTVVVSNKGSVWAIGEEAVVNLTPFVEHTLIEAKLHENDEAMDVDVFEEFQPTMLDIILDITLFERYNLCLNDIFIACHFLDYAVIRCYENSRLNMWELEFLFASDKKITTDVLVHSFLDFPVSYNKNQDQNEAHKPLIVFIHHSDPEFSTFRNLFGVSCVSPNVICLIGHPSGKLLWSLCDASKEFHLSKKLQTLFNLKQPLIGIHFVKDIEGLEDCNCMLLVGALGQLTLISSKQHPSFIQESSDHTFWTKSVHINSSIVQCAVQKDCLLHISNNGVLSLSNLSAIFHPSGKSEEVVSTSSFSEFENIDSMIVADRNKGLIILKTKHGNLYLTQLKKNVESENITSSLPSLMNECLKQNNNMQELLNKKVLQNRLFAAISTFASLKFMKNILKEPITFSISEVNEEPKKYILVINLKCLDNLNLDSELCYITATAFTFFKNNNSFYTKSAPYKSDEPTLCLEFIDTVLQPPFVHIFPLFVEVGLILQLPEEWKTIDCFKTISGFLPFYVRIETFMVHELNLLQNNALCFPQSLKFETPKTLKIIKELGRRRPVSSILQLDSMKDFIIPKKLNLCLSVSSVEKMLKGACEQDPCKYIEKILLGNIFESRMYKESYVMSKCSPISVNVSKDNSHIVIILTADNTDSLLGLRIAVMETLLAAYRKSEQSISSSAYVNIPASIYRKCEEISKALLNLYGKDVESDEVTNKIINLYKELRIDISAKLPIL